MRGTPDEAEFLSLAGELFDSAGRYDAAVGAHSRALELVPGEPAHWVNRALARASLGDFEGTIADLDRALGLDPDGVEALVFRGSAYRAAGELARATDDALQALLLEPDNLAGLWLAADVARAEGDVASARSFLQRIVALGEAGWREQAEAALQELNTEQ